MVLIRVTQEEDHLIWSKYRRNRVNGCLSCVYIYFSEESSLPLLIFCDIYRLISAFYHTSCFMQAIRPALFSDFTRNEISSNEDGAPISRSLGKQRLQAQIAIRAAATANE